jgi:transcriptional regulator with XRE-family HTH domain
MPIPISIGDHIKEVRRERLLRQCDVARLLGVTTSTINHWEKKGDIHRPKYIPLIIAWLGYDPLPLAKTHGQALRRARLVRGMTSREMALELGIDQSTLLAREKYCLYMAEKSIED